MYACQRLVRNWKFLVATGWGILGKDPEARCFIMETNRGRVSRRTRGRLQERKRPYACVCDACGTFRELPGMPGASQTLALRSLRSPTKRNFADLAPIRSN